MKKLRNILLVIPLFVAAFVAFGNKAEAAPVFTGATYSPNGYRTTCSGHSEPVDFAAYASNANLNTATGTVTYNVNIRWGTCGAPATRAYAIYADPNICPLSGIYGASADRLAYDCVKYIGDPPYSEPGNSLSCTIFGVPGTNEQCVTPVFSGARRAQNSPPLWAYDSVTIPMSYDIPGWNPAAPGSHTISSSMCQYYKTGATFTTHNGDSRCMNIGLTVSWRIPNNVEGWLDTANCTTITGWARDPDNPFVSVKVKVYIDALPVVGGREIGEFTANVYRPDPALKGYYGFSINISSYRDAYGHNIYVNAIDVQTGEEVQLQGSPRAISGAPCAPPDCSIAASPSPAATGAQFNMTLSYTYSPGSNGIRINPLGLARAIYPGSPSETIPERHNFPLSLSGASHTFDGSDGTPPDGEYRYGNPGTYSLSARIRYSYAPLGQEYDRTCGNDLDIAAQPYFKVWTNDVQVGGGFQASDGTCAVNEDQATVIAYGGDGMTNRFTGSSTQYGLSTLGEVRNFFSAALRSPRTSTKTAWPVPPHGLTFANSQVDGVPPSSVDPADSNKVANYGGKGEMPSCTQDWFATMPDGLTPVSNNSMDADTVSGAVHNNATGTVTIGGGSVGGARSIFLPNASSVVITGNIAASNGASLYIITNGDIKVSSRVRSIDAVLITTKTLYTCTNSNGSLLTGSQLYDWCGGLSADGLSGKLTIRGAVIANHIKLQRTYGTLSSSVQNESYVNAGAGGNWAAEEFIFDPTLYNADPALKQPPRAKTQIDFITSLPPIL